ncbi:hypothetical protein LMG23992_00239 [Cupriavidus laharis]|uniref:Uncharacterized protein n=1 Tax=Cupriavidus laharis TaxID=151654 RepID=A0ABN7XYH6_9BURK|nr:hypothetical protein [Cupriavidus laharis]CAG9165092.1 hypothetical protein LMG23992_00239 [Cupriavidus laharis]
MKRTVLALLSLSILTTAVGAERPSVDYIPLDALEKYYPPQRKIDESERVYVWMTKPEPGGAALEIVNVNERGGACSLGYPPPPDAQMSLVGKNGEPLAMGRTARIVSSTGEITMTGCSERAKDGVRRIVWDTPRGPIWRSYKESTFTLTPEAKRLEDSIERQRNTSGKAR